MFQDFFEITPTLNHWAVFVSALVAMVLGALWYSPVLFGNLWMKLHGWKEKDLEADNKAMLMSMLYGLLRTWASFYIFAHLFILADYEGVSGGIELALWVWFGFMFLGSLSAVIWERYKLPLLLLNEAYNLVAFVLAGIILGTWL